MVGEEPALGRRLGLLRRPSGQQRDAERAFVGLDDRGRPGVFAQDFVPGSDTASTRRPLAGFFEHDITESFDISPDGSSVILATIQEARNVMLAEGVPGF